MFRILTHLPYRFQWVYCQIAYLRGCIPLPEYIRHALDELPETLDGTYDRALRDIDSVNREFAHRLLQCVAVAFRPLRVEELAEILKFDFKTEPTRIPSFHEDRRLEDPIDAVLSTTSSLLAIEDDGLSLVIQFSHFSVKEFLTSTHLAEANDIISRRYYIPMTPAHTVIAQACLSILLHLDINVVTRDSLEKYPLVKYAARHWVDHAQFEGVSGNIEDGMKRLFDPSKSHLAIWVWIYNPEWPWWNHGNGEERPLQLRRPPLFYAVVWGLPTIVKFLVSRHAQDLHSQFWDGGLAPLHLAVREGDEDVSRVLLELGADITSQTYYGWTALHLASQGINEAVARLLLERSTDSDVAARTTCGLTPLHLASQEGVARLLLDHGADVTAQTNDGSTSLHLASRQGHGEVIPLFLEYGADLTAQTNSGSTPLHLALELGHGDVARSLLAHGADATAQTKDGSTPLHLFLGSPFTPASVEIVRLLLEHGPDAATIRTNEGSTPLHLASKQGKVNVIPLLLEYGADVTAQTDDGSTPFHVASQWGHEEVARLLLDCGADATAQTNDGSTPLHLASQWGREEVVLLLLECGADATARTKDGSTPLHLASEKGHGRVAYLLLEDGVDVSAQRDDGTTPLHIASQWGSEEVVLLLLDRGADVTAETFDGLTPLSLGLAWGQEEVTNILLGYFNYFD